MRAYFSTASEQVASKFIGQARLIMDVLGADAATAKSTDTIASEIKDKLVTRQSPVRVVAFYMSTWLKKGHVRYVEVGEPDITSGSDTPVEDPTHDRRPFPDLTGRKLSEAVLAVLEFKAKSLTIVEIVKALGENGYEFTSSQVNSAVGNLIRKETVTKIGDKVSIAA